MSTKKLLLLPHHKAKRKSYKVSPLDDNILCEREEESVSPEYIDVLLMLSVVQSVQETDIRGVLRTLLLALSERYTAVEIKEILTRSQASPLFVQNGEGNIDMDIEYIGEKSASKYARLMNLFAENGQIIDILSGGDDKLFVHKEQLEKRFLSTMKHIASSENTEEEEGGASEEVETGSVSAEEGDEQPKGYSGDADALHKGKNPKETIEKLIKQAKDAGMSDTAYSFVEGVVNMVTAKEHTEAQVEAYICTMLNGIGLMIPEITQWEIEQMLKHITQFIRTRGERIMSEQNAFFERG